MALLPIPTHCQRSRFPRPDVGGDACRLREPCICWPARHTQGCDSQCSPWTALSPEGPPSARGGPASSDLSALSFFRNGEHVFEGFRRYVHWTTERVVQGDDDNQAGRESDRQNRRHREVRKRIGAAEEQREADGETS